MNDYHMHPRRDLHPEVSYSQKERIYFFLAERLGFFDTPLMRDILRRIAEEVENYYHRYYGMNKTACNEVVLLRANTLTYRHKCPCGHTGITEKYHFCPICGSPIKWVSSIQEKNVEQKPFHVLTRL